MPLMIDYANPNDTAFVNYHFDADSMTILPVTDQRVADFVTAGGAIGAYQAPPAPPSQAALDAAAITAQLNALGSFDRALFILVLTQLNALRAAITALNTKTALAGNNVPQIPLATAVTALQNAMRGSLPS